MDIDSLVLKGKAGCFPNWHEIQSKFFVEIEPNKPLEANCCTQEEDVWVSQACQSAREGIEEIVVDTTTKTGATKWKTKVVYWKHMPNSRNGPKLLSHPRILHNTPKIIKYNVITQLS